MTTAVGQATLRLADGREQPARERLVVGRGEGNDVALDAPSVSRRHAAIFWRGERWWLEDLGSANGTQLNGERIPFGVPRPLRDGDRLGLGAVEIVFSWPAERADTNRTDTLEPVPVGEAAALAQAAAAPQREVHLSPLQRQVVRAMCGAWLGAGPLERLPTNAEIARVLGTPDAEESVKAALRRIYAKFGLADAPAQVKRRRVCEEARRQGWL